MRYVMVFSLLCFAAVSGAADWQSFMTETPRTMLALQDTTEQEGDEAIEPEPEEYVSGTQHLGKALLFSAVVPGTGQLYAGSYWKALGFVAVEAAAWYLYSDYYSDGNKIEDEFKAYADSHWSESKYWDWIAHRSGLSRENVDALREYEHQAFSHGLHVDKDQQYYEMIGKYDQFNYGWSDIDASLVGQTEIAYWRKNPSQLRLYYEGRRNASNTALKHATTSLTVVMLNHLVSSMDAAWTVSRHNRAIAEASLYFEPKQMDQQRYTALTFRMDW
jgi:hypothetical protein